MKRADDDAPAPFGEQGTPLERELVYSADADAPRADLRAKAMRAVLQQARAERRQQTLRWGAVAALVAVAAGVSFWLRMHEPTPLRLTQEPRVTLSTSAVPSAEREPDPLARCTPAVVAGGSNPLIDDLEDGDERLAILEHRAGFWMVFNDGTGTQAPRVGVPVSGVKIPGGRGQSERALHTSGGRFKNWGAVLAMELSGKRCYDASAYKGLRFWARGRGQIKVVVKMSQVVTEQYGGSCVKGCFDGHFKQVKLDKEWQLVDIPWEELRQNGTGTQLPFDAHSLLGIDFTVPPELTPFDFWIDDLSFIPR